LKAGFHFIGSTRVETGRFQAMGQLDSSCTAPPLDVVPLEARLDLLQLLRRQRNAEL
jgi:hypothetical protein